MLKNIVTVFLLIFMSISLYAQEFSSVDKLENNRYKVEVIFKDIPNVQVANKIISELRMVSGIFDVELFYPSTNNGFILLDKLLEPNVIVEKLRSINVELDEKSFKN